MIYHDRKSYEEYRDTILKLLKPIKIGLIGFIVLGAVGCYNAAMMRASGESRQTCQADSDCPADYLCVKNISSYSSLGECVSEDNYDPWVHGELEDIIKLENKSKKDEPEANNPDSRWWIKPKKNK
jgi:hypothetical protein